MISTSEAVHTQQVKLMGNNFAFSVVSDNEGWANQMIDEGIAEVRRIESLLTTYSDKSETSRINANAGVSPVTVDREVLDLIARSLRVSELTQGAFDISYGSIDRRFWNFDLSMTALPDARTARHTVRLIDYRNIVLDRENSTVFLSKKGMRIGFGGIGKGYAADRVKQLWRESGVKSGVVNASGDLTVWGTPPGADAWSIAIADPDRKFLPFASLKLGDVSVATSGNYEKYVVIDGVKYSHTINPQTGFPVRGIKSATVICGTAEIADALTTPVMVMGVKAGLGMINQMKDIACIIIDDNDRIFKSDNIRFS